MGIPFRQESEAESGNTITVCKECLQPFTRSRAWQEFCKDACRKEHHRKAGAWSLVEQEYALVSEAAEYANVSESTIRRWVSEDRVRAEKHMGRIVIRRDDLARKVRRQEGARENRPAGLENASDSVFNSWPDLKNASIN